MRRAGPGLSMAYGFAKQSRGHEYAVVQHGRLDRGGQLLARLYRAVDPARKVRAVLR